MLAKRLATIIPPLVLDEALETTRRHSVAGKIDDNTSLMTKRPFRSPHHTISYDTLVGSGTIPTRVFNQKHPIFVQILAQNADAYGQHPDPWRLRSGRQDWRRTKNHLPEIRVRGWLASLPRLLKVAAR